MRQYWADIYENRDEEEVLKHLDADFAVNECGHYVQEVGGASRPLGWTTENGRQRAEVC